MRKLLVLCLIPLIILLIHFTRVYISNEILINDYNNEKYNHKIIKYLKKVNFQEKYIVYYNEGNIAFKEKDYDKALDLYDEALKKRPPQSRRCDIRINKAVTILEMIDENATPEEILYELNRAREELYIDNCANEDGSGDSDDAEDMDGDIETQMDKQKARQEETKPKDKEDKENEEEEKIKQELEEYNREANESRQQDLQDYKNLGNYHYYSGKRW